MNNPHFWPKSENEQRAAFHVGGVDRQLSPEEQLDQLASYIHAHYPAPEKNPPWSQHPSDPAEADTFDARLPDRLTHSAMLMLGAAVDHSMPGVAFATDVTVEDCPELNAQIFRPNFPNGRWAISLHPGGWWKGSGAALEHAWRPEVAAVAQLSGVTFLDLDYPLVPEHTLPQVCAAVEKAVAWVRRQGVDWVGAWGYSSGGALAVLNAPLFDALALTFPHLDLSFLPADIQAGLEFPAAPAWPPTLFQVASHDTIAGRYPWVPAEPVEYISEHRISTPEVARQRVRDVAAFLQQ
ncbi:alpha/beta hydrolase [Corynebacterium sp. HS2168-gen11]|uniref:alpha/beta hydrolase n=1 Tax=Corynebacterium sp. HS2168-gen11 TaxID=2974027 RepID=UPI00216B63AE|nr:alpha/beta hydrolase [Corynebacterium sp. HS2168-gen11]MCS4535531.1 alpha/beta hydrolase [Corynebacterium sp. HS2168-gen11]